MIDKIIHVKNVGRFKYCCPKGDVGSFKKLTLLLAENGRGKTTLCSILRSLRDGKPELILARKTIGADDPISIQVRLNGKTASFINGNWTERHHNVSIFDSQFVHDNIYAGDYIDSEQKQNLYRVIVGAQGADVARKIDKLDERIRKANSKLRVQKEIVSSYIPKGVELEDYLHWPPADNVEDQIKKLNAEILAKERIISKEREIKEKKTFTSICLPELPKDFFEILNKTLENILDDAESQVKKQIGKQNMGRQGETWLAQGVEYIVDDACPFCGNKIRGNMLITAYRSHFNAKYSELKKEVNQFDQKIKGTIETTLNTFKLMIVNNNALEEFWKQFLDINIPVISVEQISEKISFIQKEAIDLVKSKQETPLEAVSPSTEFVEELKKMEEVQTAIDQYNETIYKYNTSINVLKGEVQSEGDNSTVKTLRAKTDQLTVNKKRFDPAVSSACDLYLRIAKIKSRLENKKNQTKEQLDKYCEQTIEVYEKSINKYLDKFNAEFRIVNTSYDYRGGTPRSLFQIQINNRAIDIGDSRTPLGTPCFKTALSAGDRNALALAFFLAYLEKDVDLNNKIVVFDDPFTSLDRFRRTCTQQLIQHFINMTKQVIVFSHDADFLQLMWESYQGHDKKALRLFRAGESTVINECDIEAETKSTYYQNYKTLLKYKSEGIGTPLSVAQAMRPFLEGLLRVRFPGHFLPTYWLGEFIQAIRKADSESGLQLVKDDLQEIEAVNDYSKKYHHDQNPHYASEIIDAEELLGYVKRTLRFVGQC